MRVLPFYDYALQFADRHPLNNGWFSGPLSTDDQMNITKVMAGFGDARSRAAYLQFLAWRVLRVDWVFDRAPVFLGNRYFIDPIQHILSDEEYFLDIGAYDGRAFLQFLKVTGEKFNSALLIEPDDKNFLSLQQTIEKLAPNIMQKITLLQGALSSASGTLPFAQGFDFASRIWDIKQNEVEVFRFDDLKFPVSFIKMHIEGGEYEALKGGLIQIKSRRPILAITVYHNRDGLWKTPILLQEALSEYVFYLRLHSWCGTGAVIYGIPRERSHFKNKII
jgi:FkbM family methyltransferase